MSVIEINNVTKVFGNYNDKLKNCLMKINLKLKYLIKHLQLLL
jgi:hypothetical protein